MMPNDMVQVATCDGSIRCIPKLRADMLINMDWLQKNEAIEETKNWIEKAFPLGCTYSVIRSEIAKSKMFWSETWLCEVAGGDVAIAGLGEIASAGNYGNAHAGPRGVALSGLVGTSISEHFGLSKSGDSGLSIAGDYGIAIAGSFGDATAGAYGIATAGDAGKAIVGDYGIATVGETGSASAGIGGVIRIQVRDYAKTKRSYLTGIVGDDGINPNVLYFANYSGLVEKDIK